MSENPQMKKLFVLFICTLILLILQLVIAEWGVKVGSNYSFLKESSYGEPGVDVMYGIRKDWQLYRWLQLRTEIRIV